MGLIEPERNKKRDGRVIQRLADETMLRSVQVRFGDLGFDSTDNCCVPKSDES